MKLKNNSQEFYTNFKENLTKSQKWPGIYMFKFIIKSDEAKIKIIESVFDNIGAIIKKKHSSNNNYTSISVNVKMDKQIVHKS